MTLGPLAPSQLGPLALAQGVGYGAYATAVRAIPNLVEYLQQIETAGMNAADSSINNLPGTYVNSPALANTAGAGASMGSAPLYTPASAQYTQLPASSLNSVWSKSEGTLSVWVKVSSSGIWTDGLNHVAAIIGVDTNNRFFIYKISTNNAIAFGANINGSAIYNATGATTSTAWLNVILSWTKTGNLVRGWLNGTAVNAGSAYSGTFTGTLTNGWSALGTLATSLYWSGWLQHYALYSRALSGTEITTLATAV